MVLTDSVLERHIVCTLWGVSPVHNLRSSRLLCGTTAVNGVCFIGDWTPSSVDLAHNSVPLEI